MPDLERVGFDGIHASAIDPVGYDLLIRTVTIADRSKLLSGIQTS